MTEDPARRRLASPRRDRGAGRRALDHRRGPERDRPRRPVHPEVDVLPAPGAIGAAPTSTPPRSTATACSGSPVSPGSTDGSTRRPARCEVFDAPRGRGPYGIATTPDGEVWYASLAGSHIARIDRDDRRGDRRRPADRRPGRAPDLVRLARPPVGQRVERGPGRRLRPGHGRVAGVAAARGRPRRVCGLRRRPGRGVAHRLRRQRHRPLRPGDRDVQPFAAPGCQRRGPAAAGPPGRSLGRRVRARPAGGRPVGIAPDEPNARLIGMDHGDHVRLLRDGVLGSGRRWADFGSGEGAFTLALADLLGPTGSIHTVDRDGVALQRQIRALRDAFPQISVRPLVADFCVPLELPPLDGIVMANSLHFERDKLAVLRLVRGYLRPAGRLVLVEYDTDHGNQWVPFPLAYHSWATLAAEAGFRDTRRLASVPSRFLGSIYSALSVR